MSDKPMTQAEKAKALQASVEQHYNNLFDAVALLSAVEGRLDESTDEGHQTLRLVQMARETVNAAADAFVDLV